MTEKTVNHLWNCAKELGVETHTERLLKSYYINTSRKLARHNVQLPEENIGPARMCARCGSQWSDGQYKLHLQPQRLASNAKRRRLIAQLEVVKAKQQRGGLSTGARKRAKWLKKCMASKMAVQCELCQHKTMLPLEKPKKRDKAKTMQPAAAAAETSTTTVRNKQHKNKDINARLKMPIQQKQTTATVAKQSTTTTTANSQSNKQKNKKKKKQQQQQTKTTPTPVQKVQSKTQKQNALLQLAAQLKTHASQNASRTQQSRLQAFLK
ncbi:uncharacterized protein LOC6579333 [Drosophila mojavensis]|uniref:uncharacterized protein LOC6579333 n=1 Tax=Drosophila mojavensis TaxID=7230 RepID=UPI00017C946E|nr:uncharacterized protein LOC6579333 [Drosophila mojavensis]XP_043866396.1 uncharacterized protein LOC6579333 [Drosophila mojavensis]